MANQRFTMSPPRFVDPEGAGSTHTGSRVRSGALGVMQQRCSGLSGIGAEVVIRQDHARADAATDEQGGAGDRPDGDAGLADQ